VRGQLVTRHPRWPLGFVRRGKVAGTLRVPSATLGTPRSSSALLVGSLQNRATDGSRVRSAKQTHRRGLGFVRPGRVSDGGLRNRPKQPSWGSAFPGVEPRMLAVCNTDPPLASKVDGQHALLRHSGGGWEGVGRPAVGVRPTSISTKVAALIETSCRRLPPGVTPSQPPPEYRRRACARPTSHAPSALAARVRSARQSSRHSPSACYFP